MRSIKRRFLHRGVRIIGVTAFLALQMCPAAFADFPWVAQEIDTTPMSSRPSAVQIIIGHLNTLDLVFFQGPGQSMYGIGLAATAQVLPNIATTCGPGAVLANKTLAIFYCGTNGHIWVASKTLNFNAPTFDKLDIVDTGFGGITSDPSAASMDGKEIDVVYRGTNGHLWQMHVSNVEHKKWTAPEDLNATIPSAPSLYIVPLDDSFKKFGLQVVFLGTNGHLWRSYWPTDTKNRQWWSGGEDMGTDVLVSAPTVDIQLGTVYYLLAPPKGTGVTASVPVIADRFFSTDNIQVRNQGWGLNAALSPPQTVPVANANFSTWLGNAVGTHLYFRDSAGHLSVVMYQYTLYVPNCPGTCPQGETCGCP